jgi:hypothetical protein
MGFLKKAARAVASGSPVAAGKSAGMFGGALKKAMPKIKEAIASGAAAPAAAVKGRGRSGLGGMLSGSYTATAKAGSANPRNASGSGLMGGSIKKAMGNMRFNEGGMASDKAGRALGKKTPDAMGRAMAKSPMKKNMGGMAKKSSKKC